ncbi:unnamed protein product, partial [Adineta steineri]
LQLAEEIDQMNEDSSQIIANNSLDIEQLKIEQGKDSTIHQKIAEVLKGSVNSSYEFKNGLLYSLSWGSSQWSFWGSTNVFKN